MIVILRSPSLVLGDGTLHDCTDQAVFSYWPVCLMVACETVFQQSAP